MMEGEMTVSCAYEKAFLYELETDEKDMLLGSLCERIRRLESKR